jgi:hypothetical protein
MLYSMVLREKVLHSPSVLFAVCKMEINESREHDYMSEIHSPHDQWW